MAGDGAAAQAVGAARVPACCSGRSAAAGWCAEPAASVPARPAAAAAARPGGAARGGTSCRPAAAIPAPLVYTSPVAGPLRVLRGFDRVRSPYAAGHRGVDLAAPGGRVLAAAAGMVTFAGPVAGRGVVVVAHRDGIRTEYEPVRARVTVGAAVAAGTVLGQVVGRHPGCAPADCLHWGARRAGAYLDPLLLLRPLGPVRLLPDP